eukprot:1750237-Rhodomonas_salina.2
MASAPRWKNFPIPKLIPSDCVLVSREDMKTWKHVSGDQFCRMDSDFFISTSEALILTNDKGSTVCPAKNVFHVRVGECSTVFADRLDRLAHSGTINHGWHPEKENLAVKARAREWHYASQQVEG